MLGLVDRSDEVVIGTTERVVKVRTVHRRGDAAYAKSIRGVPWQPNPAEAAEGEPLGMAQARVVSVPMVAVENRPAIQSWSRGITKPVGSTSGEKRSPRSTDSPMIAKGAVWRRWALKRNRMAKDPVNASDKQ